MDGTPGSIAYVYTAGVRDVRSVMVLARRRPRPGDNHATVICGSLRVPVGLDCERGCSYSLVVSPMPCAERAQAFPNWVYAQWEDQRPGSIGFRAWTEQPRKQRPSRSCGWSGLPHDRTLALGQIDKKPPSVKGKRCPAWVRDEDTQDLALLKAIKLSGPGPYDLKLVGGKYVATNALGRQRAVSKQRSAIRQRISASSSRTIVSALTSRAKADSGVRRSKRPLSVGSTAAHGSCSPASPKWKAASGCSGPSWRRRSPTANGTRRRC